MSQLPILVPATFLFTSFLALGAGLLRERWGHRVLLAGTGLAFVTAMAAVRRVVTEGELRYHLGGWSPPVGIEWVLDSLSAFMVAVITTIGLLVAIYCRRSLLHETRGKEAFAYPAIALLLAGLSGMCLTGDVFNLYVFLEIASIAAYALLSVGQRQAPMAAFRYLIIGSVGGGFYLLGVGFLYFSAGSLNMADLATLLPELYESRAVVVAGILIVTGLGLKMALFPLHLWLPDVYTFAPSAVAALIAPIMTKVSAYAIIRIFLDVFQPQFFTEVVPIASFVGWLAAAGILFGSVMAIAQTDLRRMLAYSSVGQVAYVALGFGLANPVALVGGLLHIVNHAFMKGGLFLVTGAVRLRTGSADIPRLTGLGRHMPWTMAGFTVAALAMVGIPPTAGFFSKWYLLLGTVEAGNWVFFAVVIASSLLGAVYFFRVIERIYRDPEGEDEPEGEVTAPALEPALTAAAAHEGDAPHHHEAPAPAAGARATRQTARMASPPPPREAPASMLIPILVLAVGVVAVGVFNFLIVDRLLEPAVAPLVP